MIRGRDPQRPFLLYLAFNAIHGPLQAPPATDITARGNRRELLLANLSHMDAAIGRVVATLQQQGLRDNTLIWFTGDNGGQLSQGASNGPLRGEKGGAFEGGLRVPALVSWPARFPAGQTSQQFMCAMDVLPTLCAAAAIPTGITMPIDGVDVGESIRTGQAMPRPPFVMGARDVAVFRPPFKLVQAQGVAPMLFQLEEDPTEQHDVASQHPETVAELSKLVIFGRGAGGGGGGGQGKGRRGEGEAGGAQSGMKQGQGGMKQGQGGARQGQGGMKQGQGQRQGGGGPTMRWPRSWPGWWPRWWSASWAS
jgi:arylsulfatase A-like enzyme